jgi:hypothetical protein
MARSKVAAVGLLIAAVLALAGSAQAGHPVPEPKTHVLQAVHVTAMPRVRTWETRRFSTGREVYVHVYRGKTEVRQRWVTRCAGLWSGRGLLVRVRVRFCGRARSPYVLSYVSLGGRVPFRVQVTDSSEGQLR